jgi:hypothetical protein
MNVRLIEAVAVSGHLNDFSMMKHNRGWILSPSSCAGRNKLLVFALDRDVFPEREGR